MSDDHLRLGRAVKEARTKKLQLTQAEFAARSGGAFSPKTLQRLELGRGEHSFSPSTLAGIDRAAGWKPGSARRVLDGGQPEDITPGEDNDAALIESSALLVWTAQRTGDDEQVERTYQRLAERLSREELEAVTERVVRLSAVKPAEH